MRIKYNKETDILHILFNDNKIIESDEDKPGLILDYDENGSIVSIELLQASSKIENPAAVDYVVS